MEAIEAIDEADDTRRVTDRFKKSLHFTWSPLVGPKVPLDIDILMGINKGHAFVNFTDFVHVVNSQRGLNVQPSNLTRKLPTSCQLKTFEYALAFDFVDSNGIFFNNFLL